MQIIVNGFQYDFPGGSISYEIVGKLAGLPQDQYLTITYIGQRIGDMQRSGTMISGQSISCEDGMTFTAVRMVNV